jgi:hypothetical protein
VDAVVNMPKKDGPATGLHTANKGPPPEAIARALRTLRKVFGKFRERGLFEKGYIRRYEKPDAQTLDTIFHKIANGIPLEGEERWIVLAIMVTVHRPSKKKRGPVPGRDYAVRDAIIVSQMEGLICELGKEGLRATRNSATDAPSAASIVCEALEGKLSEKQIGRIWQARKPRSSLAERSVRIVAG